MIGNSAPGWLLGEQAASSQRHLLGRVSARGPHWRTPPPPRWDHGGFRGGILLDDTYTLHLWQGRSQRGEPVHSRGAAGSPAREPAFVPCPTRGHSTGIVPGLPGKMGGVPCEIFPYTKTASELGSKEGTIQTFEKIHIHTPQPNNTHSVLRERETHELGV